MSEQITGEQLERASYDDHDGGELCRTCQICGREYHIEGGIEMFQSDSGKDICEFCENKVLRYSVDSLIDGRVYGHYELPGGEDFSTDWMPTRKEAKDRLMEVIEKLHPNIERVEG